MTRTITNPLSFYMTSDVMKEPKDLDYDDASWNLVKLENNVRTEMFLRWDEENYVQFRYINKY